MPWMQKRYRWILPKLLAIVIVTGLFFAARQPRLSQNEITALASQFLFVQKPLPEPKVPHGQRVRDVHPSLRHISSNISFVGAAVTLADLDHDGLSNDLILVDPRVDDVKVLPVPGTGDRYEMFVLGGTAAPEHLTHTAPMGTLVGDFNEDGRADILAYYWGRSPILLLRASNAVTNESFEATELVTPPQPWYTSAVSQADLDGDGHLDLIIGNYYPDGANILDPHGSGVERMPDSLSRAFNGGRNRIFLGRPADIDRLFLEVPNALTDEVACGWTFAMGAADLDGDLLPEIYFVQDFGPDRLLHNRSRPGQFEFALLEGQRAIATPRSRVLGLDSFNGMGIDFGDLNGDGILDMFVSNICSNFGLHESNFLFVSNETLLDEMREGTAPFRDESERLGLSRGGWTWDARLIDFNNDGTLEAIQAAGFVKGEMNRWPELQEIGVSNDRLISMPQSWGQIAPGDDVSGSERNPFFVRARDGRYYDIAAKIGLDEPMCSRGIAVADADGDGDLDFAVANQWERSYYFENKSPRPGAFLGLHLRLPLARWARSTDKTPAEEPSRDAIGAVVTVELPSGRRLTAQVDGGTGHSGKRAAELHFGLGELPPNSLVRTVIRWRTIDGHVRSKQTSFSPGWHTVLLRDEESLGGR